MLLIKKPKLYIFSKRQKKNKYSFKGFFTYRDVFNEVVSFGVVGSLTKSYGKFFPSGLHFQTWDEDSGIYVENECSFVQKIVYDQVKGFL